MGKGFAFLICAAAALGLAACNADDKRIAFDGRYFKAKAQPVDKKVTLADFTVTVKGVSASYEGARAAGGYEGTRYCIEKYGTSKIDWAVGPDTEGLSVIDDTITLRGTCQRP